MPILDQGGGGGDLPQVPEPGSKGSRPGPGPPGGNPGNGPPGSQFGTFGGGLRPNTFRGIPGFGSDIPIIMRRRGIQPPAPPGRDGSTPVFYGGAGGQGWGGMGQGAVPSGGGGYGGATDLPAGTAYGQAPPMQGYAFGGEVPGTGPVPPQPQDTAQISATPGEIVMNPGVTSDPVISAILTLLNILGAHHVGQQEQSGEQGFAFGGPVGLGNRGLPGRQGAQPAGQQGPPPAAPGTPGGSWQGGYTYNPEGGVTNVNPNNPWGTYGANRDPSATGQGMRTLGGYGQAGYFDPRGNQMLLNSMNEGAQGTADALVRRNMTAADLGGLDPAQRAVAKLQALRDTGRGVQDIMANTRGQVLGNANDFAQQLYLQQLQGSLGQIGQTNEARLQDWVNGNQQGRQGGGLGGFLGGVVGQGLGGFTGAYGQGLGKRLGGGLQAPTTR